MPEQIGYPCNIPETAMEESETSIGRDDIYPSDSVNVTSLSPGKADAYQQIISDDLMWKLNLYINIVICGVTALFGTLSNIVNLTIFFQLGLKESMSISLFALSMTDFLFCSLITASTAFPIWDTFFSTHRVDPMAVSYLCFDIGSDSLTFCSGWITAFMAVERCVCVIFPFRVKRIFTRNRSIGAVVVIFVVIEANYASMYATAWLEWVNQDQVATTTGNRTAMERVHRLVAVYAGSRSTVETFLDIIMGNVFMISSLVIVLVSVLWMAYGLLHASTKRQAMTSQDLGGGGGGGGGQSSDVTLKTKRLVKVVVFIGIIFTICSLPRLYATYTNLLDHEINQDGKESNLNTFLWRVVRFAATVNASVNVFVYLKTNSNYRAKCKELLPCNGKGTRREV